MKWMKKSYDLEEDVILLEDETIRIKKFKEERRKRVELFKKKGAPKEIIEYEEMISEMTPIEYENFKLDLEKQRQLEIKNYQNTHKMDEIVVKNLFRRFDEIRANPSKIRSVLFCPCETCFDMVFFGPTGIFSCNAGKFMPEEDYKMEI